MEYTRPVTGRSAAISASGVHSAGYFASTSDTCDVAVSLVSAERVACVEQLGQIRLAAFGHGDQQGTRDARQFALVTQPFEQRARGAVVRHLRRLASSRVALSTASMAESGLRCTMPSASPGL